MNRISLLLPLTFLACGEARSVTDAGVDSGVMPVDVDAGLTDAGPTDAGLTDAGAFDAGRSDAGFVWKTIAELPQCDAGRPSLDCAKQLFTPLATAPVPFDAAPVLASFEGSGVYLLPEFKLTALHVIEADATGVTDCYLGEYAYATDGGTFDKAGCGQMVFMGGHPRSLACKGNTFMRNCVDQVPVPENFDIAVRRENPGKPTLPATAEVAVGDRVYIVGVPGFAWLPMAERQQLTQGHPLVSSGTVLAVEGHAIVTDAPAYGGNSGGPLLDAQGRVLGVLSTLVGDVRKQGVMVDAGWRDSDAVVVRLGARGVEALQTKR